jgi:alpha-beta hydrolase superfamily lysophospholipase
VLLAAACAPLVQTAGAPDLAFAGARIEDGERAAFVAQDGARLGLTVWPATTPEPWAVVVGLHGMNDYAEAFTLAAPVWAEQGIATYAYDQRGFGRSPQRGVWGGEALMVEDLRTFTRLIRARHPGATLAVVGESMGGAVAIAAFASDRPPTADRLILSAPAVWGWGDQPLLYRTTLWLGAHTIGSRSVSPPPFLQRRIRASDNIEHLRRMGRDANLIFRTRIDTIYGLVSLMQTARSRIGEVRGAPLLYLYGANDDIIPAEPTTAAARALPPGARTAYYRQGFHMLTRDLQGRRVSEDIAAFVRDPAAPLPSGAPPIPRQAEPRPPAPTAPGSSAAAQRGL